MKGYKAFEPGMICKGKQYAENTVFEEDSAVVCESGMHFCKNPFNVLDHYALVSGSGEIPDFAEVEALEKPNTDNGRKYCTRKLKVDAKLNLAGFVKACVEYTRDSIEENISGDGAQMASSGDWGCLMLCR